MPCRNVAGIAGPGRVYVHGSAKGDLAYTDAAYQGLSAARGDMKIEKMVPRDYWDLPVFPGNTGAPEWSGPDERNLFYH